MKKTIILSIVALLYFATNVNAQVVYQIQKIGDDTVYFEQGGQSLGTVTVLGDHYGHYSEYKKSPLMESYRNGTYFENKLFPRYSCFGLLRQSITIKYVYDRNTHIQNSSPIYAPIRFAWEMVIVWGLTFLFTFFLIKYSSKTRSLDGVTEAILLITGLYIVFSEIAFLFFGLLYFWLPLIINTTCLFLGGLSRYLYNRRRK